MTRDSVLSAARELPREDQVALAWDLLQGAEWDPDVEAAWESVVMRRLDELEAGVARTVTCDEAMRRWTSERAGRAA